MAETTAIAWTDHTFNPVSGCAKISAGCANCYAAALPPAMRRHAEWGPTANRVFASESYWNQPIAWNRAAEKAGVRRRVFCASVADIFEGRPGSREGCNGPREDYLSMLARLFTLIADTPWLDWQLLTKRPWNATTWYRNIHAAAPEWTWPDNAWIGTTVEDSNARNRILWLRRIPARVTFLSCEPLLGPLELLYGSHHTSDSRGTIGASWVILGGESGRNARYMGIEWARSLVRQCRAADVPVFVKQLGTRWAKRFGATDPKGGDPAEWPEDLRVRQFPPVEAKARMLDAAKEAG